MIPARLQRRRYKPVALVAIGAMLAVATGTLAHSAAGAAPAMTPAAAGSPSMHSVTLITGDVVVLHDVGGGRQAVEVRRPHGAVGGVRTETIGTDLYVFPDEVLPYVAAERAGPSPVRRDLADQAGLRRSAHRPASR